MDGSGSVPSILVLIYPIALLPRGRRYTAVTGVHSDAGGAIHSEVGTRGPTGRVLSASGYDDCVCTLKRVSRWELVRVKLWPKLDPPLVTTWSVLVLFHLREY